MRILHVDTERGWRGGEQQLFYLVKGLKEKGFKQAVACRVGDELEKRCREAGIEVIPLKGNQLSDHLRIAVIGKEFDIIHAHSAKAHTISALSKRFHRKPVIYTRRVDYPPKKNSLTRLKYRLTDAVVAVSQKVKTVLEEELRIEREKLRVIYSVTDPEIEKKVDKNVVERFRKSMGNKIIIGSTAALTKQKNIPNLIEAASIVVKEFPDTVFVVFGEGHLRKELESLIEKKCLKDHFKLPGFKRDIYNYIKAFDVFVLPSDNEGFSGAILNAMALKVPVVTTDAGGASEIIKNGENGIMVERRNPIKLAEGIIKVLRKPYLREKLIDNAYRIVTTKFSVNGMVKKYTEVYQEILSKQFQ